jgi:hypothetical protein
MKRKLFSGFAVFAISLAAFFAKAQPANAQVIGSTAVDPWTGKVIEQVGGYNPYIEQFGQGRAYYNPYTGSYGRSGVGYNPFTGMYTGTVERYNPWLGRTMIQERAYNPYTGQFGWRNYALPGRW